MVTVAGVPAWTWESSRVTLRSELVDEGSDNLKGHVASHTNVRQGGLCKLVTLLEQDGQSCAVICAAVGKDLDGLIDRSSQLELVAVPAAVRSTAGYQLRGSLG